MAGYSPYGNEWTPPGQPFDASQLQQDAQTTDRSNSIRQWYKQYTGRDAQDSDVTKYLGSANFGTVENDIAGSDEAKAFGAKASAPKNSGDFWGDLMGSGGKNPDDLKNFLVSSGYGAAGYKQSGKKGDHLIDPTGKDWDAIYSAGDPTHSHYQKFDPMAASYSAATGGAAGPGGMGAGAGYPPGVGDAIRKLLTRGFTTPSDSDPEIAAQLAPTNRAIQRGADRTRQAAAERAAASGNLVSGEGSGSFDANVNAINEDAGEQSGKATGQVIAQEVMGRRQDIVNALQFAQGEEKMALEAQLAQADNDLRRLGLENQRYGMDQQNQQFYDTFAANLSRGANDDAAFYNLFGG